MGMAVTVSDPRHPLHTGDAVTVGAELQQDAAFHLVRSPDLLHRPLPGQPVPLIQQGFEPLPGLGGVLISGEGFHGLQKAVLGNAGGVVGPAQGLGGIPSGRQSNGVYKIRHGI